jgi:cytochrome d ubiquinol oxidase subunit II
LGRARSAARAAWLPAVALVVLFVGASFFVTDIFTKTGLTPGPVPLVAAIFLLAAGWLLRKEREGWAFAATGLTIILATATVFMGLFPRVMISSLNPSWSLTIHNASSSPYTLQVMTVVAAMFVPIVLLYEGWTYWAFRKRLTRTQPMEY